MAAIADAVLCLPSEDSHPGGTHSLRSSAVRLGRTYRMRAGDRRDGSHPAIICDPSAFFVWCRGSDARQEEADSRGRDW